MKRIILTAVVLASALALVTAPVLANMGEGGGKSCPVMKKGCDKGMGHKQCQMSGKCAKGGSGCAHASSGCPISAKFCSKACWLLEHKDELGLTDEQTAKIKSLDLEVEKNSIRGMAEMKIFALEMENRLSQTPVDVEGIESMIDSGMAGMATGAKATVRAYAELKTVLTEEQKTKGKELKKAGHEGHHHHKA